MTDDLRQTANLSPLFHTSSRMFQVTMAAFLPDLPRPLLRALAALLLAVASSSCELGSSTPKGRGGAVAVTPTPLETEEAIAARDMMLNVTGGADVWKKLEPWRAPFNNIYTMHPGGAMQVKYDSSTNHVHFKGGVRLVDTCPGRRYTWKWAYEGALSINEFIPQDDGSFICMTPIPPVKYSFSISNRWENLADSKVEIVFLKLTQSGLRLVADDKFIMSLQP